MTSEELRMIWDRLEEQIGQEPSSLLVPTQILDSPELDGGKPIVALDAEHRKHLLLPISMNYTAFGDRRSTGVQILVNIWNQTDDPVRTVDIVCFKAHLSDLFNQIVVEILDRLPKDIKHPDAVARGVLDRWRELLGREASPIPDASIILGMLGELNLLHRLHLIDHSAIQTWTGPNSTRHDFSGSQMVIEVKSTQQRQGLTITINGVDQLIPPDGARLILHVIRFEESPIDGKSVSDMVDRLRVDGVDYLTLMTKLANVGFTPEVLALTKDTRFRVLESLFYEVASGFPRIIPQSFVGGEVPTGILALVYRVDLSTRPPHPIDEDSILGILRNFLGGTRDGYLI